MQKCRLVKGFLIILNTTDSKWEIYKKIKALLPELKCELNYNNMFELLVAVVLSAQCTDKRVNLVTPTLFAKYPTPYAMAKADMDDLKAIIHSCGTYTVKARNIKALSQSLVDNFGGQVPRTMEELITLAGVGRKTASVVLAEGYKIPAFPVDTHILRVCNRLGFVHSSDPVVVENRMKQLFPEENWIELHYLLLLFGRYHCKAVGYSCENCVLHDICKFDQKK